MSPWTSTGWITLALVLSTGAAAGELHWRWSHPLPHGNNIADLAYQSGRYVEVTDFGGIYVSTNRAVWEPRKSATSRDLRGVAYLRNRLLITGEEGTVLWSDDALVFNPGTLQPSPTTDWLEGVAASTNRAVAVGDNGAIYQSIDGKAWSRVQGLGFSDWLSGVAFGGNTFVAVGENGFIASSTNGTSWVRRNSKTALDLTRVVYGNKQFFAVGSKGLVLVSTNGSTWSADASTGITNALLAAAVAPFARLAVGESAVRLLRPPSKTWEDMTSALLTPSPAPDWTYLASVWDGTRFVVAGRTGVAIESLHTNFSTVLNATLWFRLDDSPRNWLWDAEHFDGAYLAVGDRGTILSSPSGSDWELESSPADSETILYGIGGSPDTALAVGSAGTILRSAASFTNVIVTNLVVAGGRTNEFVTTNRVSLLGVYWDSITNGVTTNTLQGVAWDGVQFVVVGGNGAAIRSPDGIHWESAPIASTAFFSSVTPFRGRWIASGSRGNLYTSPDAVTWTSVDSGTTNWVYRVRAFEDTLVAVGENGLILVSTNSTQWEVRPSGTQAWLTDIRKVTKTFYSCGVQGTILRSTNLVVWEPIGIPTGKALNGMATSGAQLIAAGAEGIILRAVADATAAPVAISAFSHRNDSLPPVDLFAFEGAPEQTFLLETAQVLGNWNTNSESILSPSGTSVLGRTGDTTVRFYRTRSGQ